MSVRKDSVSGNWIMSPGDVKCLVSRLEVPLHMKCVGTRDSLLSGLFTDFQNRINIDPTKLRPEFFIIRSIIVNNMFVGPKTCWLALMIEKGVSCWDESSKILVV